LLAASLLAGCTTLPGRPLPARQQVGDFALEARFALRINTPGEAVQSSGGRLSWQQKNGRSRLLLSNPLGFGIAEIESTPGHATLRTANGETRESDNPDSLLEEVTGQRLPVSRLPDWLLGRSTDPTKIQRDFLGRPQQLLDAGWQVDYTYDNAAAEALPSVLKLNRNGEIELRLRIEEWKDAP
jgi:outer membrane lipoprotein LolB